MLRANGLTTLELLISLAIVAVIAAIALPALSQWIDRHRIEVGLQAMTRSLALARNEAVKRRGHIGLFNMDNRWEQGWQVFFDRNGNGIFDVNEPLLHQQSPIGGLRIRGNTPLRRLVTYNKDGRSTLPGGGFQAGAFFLCPNARQFAPYKLVLARGGRVRVEKLAPGAEECAE